MVSTSLWDDVMTALNLPDPQSEERGIYAHGWVSFIGWAAGIALALAFVARPLLVMSLVVFAPDRIASVPDIPLGAMWPPVLAIVGAGGTRVFGNLVRLREARKTQEMTLRVCGNCPAKGCEDCPLRAMLNKAVKPSPSVDVAVSVGGQRAEGSPLVHPQMTGA